MHSININTDNKVSSDSIYVLSSDSITETLETDVVKCKNSFANSSIMKKSFTHYFMV